MRACTENKQAFPFPTKNTMQTKDAGSVATRSVIARRPQAEVAIWYWMMHLV